LVSFFIYGKPAGLSELDCYMSIANYYAPQGKFTSNTRKPLRPKPRIFFEGWIVTVEVSPQRPQKKITPLFCVSEGGGNKILL